MIEAIRKILRILSLKERKIIIFVLILIFTLGFVETIGIAILLPFLDYLLNNDNSEYLNISNYFSKYNLQLPNFLSKVHIITLSVSIAIFYILKNIYIISAKYYIFTFSNNIQKRISLILLENFLLKDLNYYQQNNTSKIINLLMNQIKEFKKVLSEFLNMVIEGIIIITILAFILLISDILVIYFGIIVLIIILLNFFLFKKIKIKLDEKKNKSRIKSLNILREYFQNIKGILIENNKNFFVNNYSIFWKKFLNTQVMVALLRNLPKALIEILIIISILILINFNINSDGNTDMLTKLSIYLVALIRIYPSINKITHSISVLRFNVNSYDFIEKELYEHKYRIKEKNTNESNNSKITDFKNLEIKNISFGYDKSKLLIKDLNLTFKKGQIILIKGKSGSGKTTILNLLTGLLDPDEGSIRIDKLDIKYNKKNYQGLISYIPQEISLMDDTLLNNILFTNSKDEINQNKIEEIIKLSGLQSFVKELNNGINSNIGEFGSKISGGQKQRIYLARALYKKSKIYVFDEFTSSLDKNIEKDIINSIQKLKSDKIIFIVSHGDAVDRYADQIIDLNKIN